MELMEHPWFTIVVRGAIFVLAVYYLLVILTAIWPRGQRRWNRPRHDALNPLRKPHRSGNLEEAKHRAAQKDLP